MTTVLGRALENNFAEVLYGALILYAGCASPGSTVCHPDHITQQRVADGVSYYDCSGTETNVHVVTIGRNRGNSEIWLLDEQIPLPGAAGNAIGVAESQNGRRPHQAIQCRGRHQRVYMAWKLRVTIRERHRHADDDHVRDAIAAHIQHVELRELP